MSIAKRIAANRAQQERGMVEVPEWGEEGQPLRLYFGPVTARDIERVQRKHPNFLSNITMGAMVETLILKCEDDKGEPAFTLEDKPILMREQVGIISQVAAEMMSGPTVEDQEKN